MGTEQHQSEVADTGKTARLKRKNRVILLTLLGSVCFCCGMYSRWLFVYPVFYIETDDYGFNSVTYSPDGTQLTTVYTTAYASIYDIEAGEEVLQLEGSLSLPYFSPDGNYLVTTDSTTVYFLRRIRIWDARTGEELSSIKTPVGPAHFHPELNQVLAVNHFTGDIEVWDIETGELLLNIDEAYARSALFSPDGSKIYGICKVGSICVWDASTGEQLLEILADESDSNWLKVVYSPDGSYIASLDYGIGPVNLWDASSGKKLGVLRDPRLLLGFADIAISPNGKYVAGLGTFGNLVIWHKNTRLPVRFYSGLLFESRDGYATSVEFSPTGDTLTVTGDSELQVLEGNWD